MSYPMSSSSSTSDTCNSRHFQWLVKSCFPDPHHPHHPQPYATIAAATTISALPDDLLLECLSRVPHSTLPSLPSVCRRWAHLMESQDFNSLLHLTLFSVSVHSSALFTATHNLDYDSDWRVSSFVPSREAVLRHGSIQSLFSHSRVAAIGRKIYIIGREAMLQCDSWTGNLVPKSGMLVQRKKFAVAVVNGRIYVAGGSSRSSVVEEYDPVEDSWRVVSHAPRRRYGCIGATVDGLFCIIGGLRIWNSVNGSSGLSSRAAGAESVNFYASSMDVYDVAARAWLRSRAVPGGGCVVAACASEGFLYVLSSHAVEVSFWRFNGSRRSSGFGEWCRIKSPPLPAQVRLDSTVRFSCLAVEQKVVLIQVVGCIDDVLRRAGRSERGMRDGLVMIYDCVAGEWSRGVDLPEVIRRPACVCVLC